MELYSLFSLATRHMFEVYGHGQLGTWCAIWLFKGVRLFVYHFEYMFKNVLIFAYCCRHDTLQCYSHNNMNDACNLSTNSCGTNHCHNSSYNLVLDSKSDNPKCSNQYVGKLHVKAMLFCQWCARASYRQQEAKKPLRSLTLLSHLCRLCAWENKMGHLVTQLWKTSLALLFTCSVAVRSTGAFHSPSVVCMYVPSSVL